MAPSRSWLTALAVLCAGSSFAAQPDGGADPAVATDVEALRRELDATRKDLKEMREEVRAQLATQSVAQGWSEDFVEEKRKLEVFVPEGYFRVRPDLFHHFDLGRNADPAGYTTFPIPPTTPRGPDGQPLPGATKERTEAGVNMRFRFEPTFNVSEEVRIRMQIDALDNVLMGSTPDYAFSRDPNHVYDRDSFTILSGSQAAPRSGINALGDSIAVKRIWGEVSTPVGILRFGRMGSHWGLGIQHNDGNCLDCDFGDTVDRVMFVAEPLAGFFITPMIDINAEGPSSYRQLGGGQPWDASNSDDAHSAVLAIARRDTESQARARLEAGQSVFNYGLHLTYRWQRNDPADFYGKPFTDESATNASAGYVQRLAQIWIPDIWVKFERSSLRLELEASAVLGNISNIAQTGAEATQTGHNQGIGIIEFGAALQGEYKLLDGALSIQAEVGFASGDDAPGFGNFPRRRVSAAGTDNITQPGDIDGPQYACQSTGGCSDSVVRNFRFNRDYRIDMILFREILGGVTDALYIKPTVKYRIADGFHAFGSVIYSRAMYLESTPSYQILTDGTHKGDANLGFEINLGARYETEDGFFGELRWGILFPLGGFSDPRPNAPTSLDSAQALRGSVGIKF
jgi:uncharacterized protein (TIGR04551 family)